MFFHSLTIFLYEDLHLPETGHILQLKNKMTIFFFSVPREFYYNYSITRGSKEPVSLTQFTQALNKIENDSCPAKAITR
jgi:hypothetical protein